MNTSKIIACNLKPTEALIESNLIPEQYLASNYKEVYNKYTSSFNTSKFLYDRTGTIPHYLNVDSSKYPIPNSDKFNLSFSEVVEKRAKELLALDKPINVSWSGGLDSTFILMTLYHYANDKSQIKVYGTYSSIIESGYFFDKYIKDKFHFDIHTNKTYKNNYKVGDEIVVTGSNGNDIFYKDIIQLNSYDSWMKFKDPVSDNIKRYADSPYSTVLQECNIEFLHEFIKNSPRKIETVQDLRWWVAFSFNWYTTASNSYIGVGKETASKIHSFFGCEDFQLWSMYNKDSPTKTGDYTDDRWQLREMISEYTGDEFYSKNKQNFLSVLSRYEHDWVFLLNDYSNIYMQDL